MMEPTEADMLASPGYVQNYICHLEASRAKLRAACKRWIQECDGGWLDGVDYQLLAETEAAVKESEGVS